MNNTAEKQQIATALEHHKAGRLDEAAVIYRQVLKKNPQSANANHLMGLVEMKRSNHRVAVKLIEKALSVNPNSAVFHHNIAGVYGQLGELDVAERHSREAVRLDPTYAEAYQGLVESKKFKEWDPLLDKIQEQLDSPKTKPEARCYLHFAAGKIYDDIKDYENAFKHFDQGNKAKHVKYKPEHYSRVLAQIKHVFTKTFIEARAPKGLASRVPIFIVGMPRSGTSLLEQMLASHSSVFGAGELPDIASIAATLSTKTDSKKPFPTCMSGVLQSTIQGFAVSYLNRVQKMSPQATRIVDKHPLNFQYIGLIKLMFPNAAILHTRRDPRDTCVSCYYQNFTNGQEFSFNLEHLGHFYSEYHSLMQYWKETMPGFIKDVYYDDLVNDTECQLREIVDFCGLDWEPSCLEHTKTERPVQTASRWQVRQPIYKDSLKRWQRYGTHFDALFKVLDPFVKAYESRR